MINFLLNFYPNFAPSEVSESVFNKETMLKLYYKLKKYYKQVKKSISYSQIVEFRSNELLETKSFDITNLRRAQILCIVALGCTGVATAYIWLEQLRRNFGHLLEFQIRCLDCK